ncbi:exosome complex protein Rrp4 [Candidatus Woesearchaeota archaeon]|nr:exosome complex protein Rrp4 [Candidatus Woesearchaeota archaeon]
MESKLLLNDKGIVVPGEEIARGMDYLPSSGTYRLNDSIYAEEMGILNVDGKVLKIRTLKGDYMPKRNDTIIVQVTDIMGIGWLVDTASPYRALLPLKEGSSDFIKRGADLTRYYDIGDFIVVKILSVDSQQQVDVTTKGPGLRKVTKGRIFNINSSKVPRVIGKQGSMISLIKENTGAQITVGQNGVVWIYAEDPLMENLTEQAIKKIEAEAHTSGLTDKMQDWLKEKVGNKKPQRKTEEDSVEAEE